MALPRMDAMNRALSSLSLIPLNAAVRTIYRSPQYVARMEHSGIRGWMALPVVFPAFRCASCGLRVAPYAARVPQPRSKMLNRLLKNASSPRRKPGSRKLERMKSVICWIPAYAGMTDSDVFRTFSATCVSKCHSDQRTIVSYQR